MRSSRVAGLPILLVLASATTFAAKPKPCIDVDQAGQMLNKDICISAHIFDVVEVQDGTRYLDVCSPSTPDDACRFTVISPTEDRRTVGELMQFRNHDVRIRGVVETLRGRSGIILNHARQFSGGPPKFAPNPLLAHGFSGEKAKPPVSDPNLRGAGVRRSFMSPAVQEAAPRK